MMPYLSPTWLFPDFSRIPSQSLHKELDLDISHRGAFLELEADAHHDQGKEYPFLEFLVWEQVVELKIFGIILGNYYVSRMLGHCKILFLELGQDRH